MRPKNRPCSTAADGPGSWEIQSSPMSPRLGEPARHEPGQASDLRGDRRAEGQRHQQRGEGQRAAEQRVVEHRHLDDHAAQPLRRRQAASSVALAPSEVPPTTASSIPRWSSSAMTCSPKIGIE